MPRASSRPSAGEDDRQPDLDVRTTSRSMSVASVGATGAWPCAGAVDGSAAGQPRTPPSTRPSEPSTGERPVRRRPDRAPIASARKCASVAIIGRSRSTRRRRGRVLAHDRPRRDRAGRRSRAGTGPRHRPAARCLRRQADNNATDGRHLPGLIGADWLPARGRHARRAAESASLYLPIFLIAVVVFILVEGLLLLRHPALPAQGHGHRAAGPDPRQQPPGDRLDGHPAGRRDGALRRPRRSS